MREWIKRFSDRHDTFLREHLKLIVELLDKTYEKTIKTIYRGNQLRLNEELRKLTELRNLKSKNPDDI